MINSDDNSTNSAYEPVTVRIPIEYVSSLTEPCKVFLLPQPKTLHDLKTIICEDTDMRIRFVPQTTMRQ